LNSKSIIRLEAINIDFYLRSFNYREGEGEGSMYKANMAGILNGMGHVRMGPVHTFQEWEGKRWEGEGLMSDPWA
jgi:hypothetical protein